MRMRFLLVRWRSSYGNACRRPHFQLASRKRLLHDSKALWRCPAHHQNGRCSRNIFAKAPMVKCLSARGSMTTSMIVVLVVDRYSDTLPTYNPTSDLFTESKISSV